MRALVLRGRVVPPLARGAREGDDLPHRLLRDLRDDAGPHRPPPLPDRKPQLLLHRHRRDQLDRHRHVVPRHHHLHPRRQRHHPRHVRRPEIKLRPVPVEKRRVPPPLLLRQHVYLRLAPLVRRDRPRLRHHLPPLHFLLVHPPQQTPHIIPRLPLVQQLPEHLHPRHHRLARLPKPHHLHFLPHPYPPPPHPPPFPPPRSTRPVTTVPRPVIEKISSIGIKNGLSIARCGVGM